MAFISFLTYANFGSACLVLLAIHSICIGFYRLYLSPLASIPGPKLAALTYWYECFYDVFQTGKYAFKLKDLHEQYGPIVRLNPREISISDPSFVDTIYAPGAGSRRNKDIEKAKTLGTDTSLGGAVGHDLHRLRRAALAPFFSQKAVWSLTDLLERRFKQMESILMQCVRNDLEEERKIGERKGVVNLSDVYFAVANDIVKQYCFGYEDGMLANLDRAKKSRENLAQMLRGVKFTTHFGWVQHVMGYLPTLLRQQFEPKGVKDMQELRKSIHNDVAEVLNAKDAAVDSAKAHSILYGLRDSEALPPHEKTAQRLEDEATLLVMAGTESTAKSLTIAHFYLLSQPEILSKLRSELLSYNYTSLPLSQLQDLPYLSAIITESHRLSFGLTGRNPRCAPDETLIYTPASSHQSKSRTSPQTSSGTTEAYALPPLTPISAPTLLIHTDPAIFPDPWRFQPERWLGEDGRKRRKHMLSFIQGPRKCVGMNLANAEMVAMLRTAAEWEMELAEGTSEEDVKFLHDYHVASARLDSHGVKARVLGRWKGEKG